MATYSCGITQVSFYGSESEYYSSFYYWYWGFSLQGYVYESGRSRYLHIDSVSVTLRVKPQPDKIGHSYLQEIIGYQPGQMRIRFRCVTSQYDPSGTIYSNREIGFWTDTSLSDYVESQLNPMRDVTYQRTFTSSVNQDLPLTNNKCYLNLYLTTEGTNGIYYQYTDWGNLTGGTFEYWEPNVPGVQYYSSSGWETHRIKRWNGSSWADIPGRRWDGSWNEVKG